MPKLKPGIIFPTADEDAAITAGAMQDPDALPYTDAEWERVRFMRVPGQLAESGTNVRPKHNKPD